MRTFAWLVLMCGCSTSAAPASALYHSGSRLKIHWLEGDGAELFQAFHDTMLDDDCLFQPGSDGVERCYPSNAGGLVYTDAACTMPIGASSCGQVKFVVEQQPGQACSGDTIKSVYRAAVDSQSHDAYYVPQSDGSCQRFDTQPGQIYYTLTPFDVTQLVAVTTQQQKAGTTLVAEVAVGDDGSRALAGLRDAKRDASCQVQGLGASNQKEYLCLPPVAYQFQGQAFADATCTMPAAFSTAGCPTPELVIDEEPTGTNACGGYQNSLYAIGDKLAGAYHGSPSSCSPTMGGDFWAIGAAAAASDWPALTLTNDGTGRVRVPTYHTSDGAALDGEGTFDFDRGEGCSPLAFSDGKRYCVPDSAHRVGAMDQRTYKDAACTQEILLQPSPCPGEAVTKEVLTSGDACGLSFTEVRPVSAAAAVTQYWFKSPTDTMCFGPADLGGQQAWDVGASVDPSTRFGQVSDRVE